MGETTTPMVCAFFEQLMNFICQSLTFYRICQFTSCSPYCKNRRKGFCIPHTHSFQVAIEHILDFKTNFKKFRRIEIVYCMLCDHNIIKLEISNRKGTRKFLNTWKLYNAILNNLQVNEEVSGEIKKKTTHIKLKIKIRHQNLWDMAEAELRQQFISQNAYVGKEEKY